MAALILLAVGVNVLIYGGIIQRGEAVTFPALVGAIPPGGGNAPGSAQITDAQRAELDSSPELPGRYVASQGKLHIGEWPSQRVPFCPPGQVTNECYASRPPTSGLHVPVTRNALLPDGSRIDLPPDPGVYDVRVPREAIPHIQEHAGVYVGYSCRSDACRAAVERAKAVVEEQLGSGARVVMAPSDDLPGDTFGIASWTRYDAFDVGRYDDERLRAFIEAHSCRYDPEGFCEAEQRPEQRL